MTALQAADLLAALLRDKPWYHRTSVRTRIDGIREHTILVVWGERGQIPELPATWHGYTVLAQTVDAEHPCPFGSVKEP